MNRRITLSLLVLILAAVACNLPQPTPEPTQVIIITATPLPATNTPLSQPSPLPTLPTFPTNTPLPTATVIPCNQAAFITDVTIPDNTQISVGDAFTKVWRIKNTGTCTWTSAYQVVFESGDLMAGPTSKPITAGTVAPGQTVDISVDLIAPSTVGTYRGNWRLREPGGTLFGVSTGTFWVQIKAVAKAPSLPDWPTFTVGDDSIEVWAIQYLLRIHGQTLTPDGIFGPQTRVAVINFQSAVGLTQDGIVGAKTWAALISGVQLNQGNSGDGVRAIQTLLSDKYGYTLTIDGVFGPQTTNAVRNFQDNYELNVDGIVGPSTWQALIAY